ncbi:MAG: 2-oxo acid dehydrogenase subunit E2 [Planctomycetota bacterium]
MATKPIIIPQLGEGLQEARLMRFLKQPGESVKRDEPLFEMETDKAVTEVESPYAGIMKEWLVEEDTVLDIGAEIGTMEVEGADAEEPVAGASPEPESTVSDATDSTQESAKETPAEQKPADIEGSVPIPPRTRRYIKEKGLEAVAGQIPASGKRLTEEDVDRYLADQSGAASASEIAAGYSETELPSAQQTLNYRMARGVQVVVPAVLETDLDWRNIQTCRDKTRDVGGPTSFAMVLWCVTKAMADHAPLRSSLSADGKTLRTYRHVNLGVAVGLPGDQLVTAVVRDADTLTQTDFFASLSSSIDSARNGKDQVDATTTVSVSNIGATDMRAGVPVVVAPAVATLAVGQVRPIAVQEKDLVVFHPFASVTMSFDHRLMNGIGASNFLGDVRKYVAEFTLE